MRKYIISISFLAYDKPHLEYILLQKQNAPSEQDIQKLATIFVKEICFTSVITEILVYEIEKEIKIANP